MMHSHSMPFGAELLSNGSVRFRLWAPKAQRVDLCLEDRKAHLPLSPLEHGWFELITAQAGAGTLYRFRIDDAVTVPDPASRYQPSDVYGPSEVIDPRFPWNDDKWTGRPWEEAAIYELHVGTFTPDGTFLGVEQKLDYLAELGVTAIEIMPVADFAGTRNWGYDGVLLFAPESSYGRPEDLKRLIRSAHRKGLMVFLDVVYNHFGPEGNYLGEYSPQFFTSRHHTPWGDGINFDGTESRTVRDFFIHNALYWLEELHFDGLRLDAIHAIADDSSPDIVTELANTVRERFGAGSPSTKRFVHLILENDANAAHYLRRGDRARIQLYDAQWNDDIHHTLHALITGESDGYYAAYARHPIKYLCRSLSEGFAFQGEYSEYHGTNRGEPSAALPPTAFISFLQNHDQVGNRAFGERIVQLAPPEALKAAMATLFLAPSPPMIFMGEEFGATTPFLFFCDFTGELAAAVTTGRRNEFARFSKFNSSALREQIPDPNAAETFLRSKLDWESAGLEPHSGWLSFYRELMTLRSQKIIPIIREISEAHVISCDQPHRALAIDWKLKRGGALRLKANLGTGWLLLETASAESEIYRSHSKEAGPNAGKRLPPWSVIWSLAE
jgi:maltooligosyltrehalose trehalohydrolase